VDRLRVARWKVEAFLAASFAVGTIITAIVPRWIEALGFEPDRGDGGAEWTIVAVLGVATLVSAALSRRHHLMRRRPPLAGEGPTP
jgi:hypothetical protein